MKFAVVSEDFQTISGHPGHACRFLLFEAEVGQDPKEIGRIELSEEQTFHQFQGGAHPLDGVQVLIAGSAGECFVGRMRERGITTVAVPNMAPATAVAAYLMGVIGPLTNPGACHCGHEH